MYTDALNEEQYIAEVYNQLAVRML